jgi:hypothetical protein
MSENRGPTASLADDTRSDADILIYCVQAAC